MPVTQTPFNVQRSTSTFSDSGKMPANSSEYMLWCCRFNDPDCCFPVIIRRWATVDELKKNVKMEMHPELQDVAYDQLVLWRVSFPSREMKCRAAGILYPHTIQGAEKLEEPTEKLLDIFAGGREPQSDNIHIIVRYTIREWHAVV